MSKRPRSTPERIAKRPRLPSPLPSGSSRPTGGLGLLPLFDLDELFLRVLGWLGPSDLARAQQVSKRWSAIAVDPQLWKRLYLARWPHPHEHAVRRSRSRAASASGSSTPVRPIARHPSRAFPPPSPSPSPAPEAEERRDERWKEAEARHDGVDWKLMMRLGVNWSNGAVLSEARVPLSSSSGSDGTQQEQDRERSHADYGTGLALFPSFICTSNPRSPLVHVYSSLPSDPASPLGIIPPPPGWSSPHRPDVVTAIAADESVAVRDDTHPALPARLAILYASGGFAVVRLRLTDGRLHWSRESVWGRRERPPRLRSSSLSASSGEDPVVLAAMYHPVLVTCTRGFVLSVFSLAGEPTLLDRLSSDVAFHPASLSLSPPSQDDNLQSKSHTQAFRAALTYSAPVYPASWTVAVQELQIDVGRRDVRRSEAYTVTPTSDGMERTWPRRVAPLPGVRGPVGVGSDGRWCVQAGDDAVIYVYAIGEDRVTHAQTLLAPSAGVASIALQAGRCVSGGRDGLVLVWDLDEEVEDGEHSMEGAESGEWGEARVGRVPPVEVRRGGRRAQPATPFRDKDTKTEEGDHDDVLPHPTAISRLARGLFLATPPATLPPARRPASPGPDDSTPPVRQLAFDEEKIVGLVDGPAGDVMRVWSFV